MEKSLRLKNLGFVVLAVTGILVGAAVANSCGLSPQCEKPGTDAQCNGNKVEVCTDNKFVALGDVKWTCKAEEACVSDAAKCKAANWVTTACCLPK